MKKSKVFAVAVALLISGCASSGYEDFYHPYVDNAQIPAEALLGPDEKPQLIQAGGVSMSDAVKRLRSRGYDPIGYSSFNGSVESPEQALAQAKRVGAVLVLVASAEHTGTRTITSPLILPNNTTTQSSGTVYAGGVSGGYSGTSTTYGTRVVPITRQQERYDQGAVYFVRATRKGRLGISMAELSPEMRQELQRNTGAVVDIVMEDSPAFLANVLEGDVIIEADGQTIRNAGHLREVIQHVARGAACKLVVIRRGEQKNIEITLP